MKFGLFGSAQAKRGQGPDVDSAKGYRDYLEYNVEAEALGFHSAFAVEHHFTGFGQVSATINLLTYLAAQTTTLRLGTAVMVLPWHNPVLLAEQAATLDLLSGGRLDFGVGKGYRYNEFEGFGIPMEEAGERFEEGAQIEISRPFIRVVRNEAAYDNAIAIQYADAVNTDSFAGALPGQVKLCNITADIHSQFAQDARCVPVGADTERVIGFNFQQIGDFVKYAGNIFIFHWHYCLPWQFSRSHQR